MHDVVVVVMFPSEKLDTWAPGSHTGTFRGNQMAMVAGKASIDFMLETKLWEEVASKGEQLAASMKALQSKVQCINDVRGRGLMQGIEIVNPSSGVELDRHGMKPLDGALAGEIQFQCTKRGMILERGGRDGAIIRFLVPLIVTPEELDICTGIFGEAVPAAQKKLYGI